MINLQKNQCDFLCVLKPFNYRKTIPLGKLEVKKCPSVSVFLSLIYPHNSNIRQFQSKISVLCYIHTDMLDWKLCLKKMHNSVKTHDGTILFVADTVFLIILSLSCIANISYFHHILEAHWNIWNQMILKLCIESHLFALIGRK